MPRLHEVERFEERDRKSEVERDEQGKKQFNGTKKKAEFRKVKQKNKQKCKKKKKRKQKQRVVQLKKQNQELEKVNRNRKTKIQGRPRTKEHLFQALVNLKNRIQ